MILEFPRFVFKDIGEYQRPGGTYSSELVEDQHQYDAALKSGWFSTLDAALAPPAPVGPQETAPEPEVPEVAEVSTENSVDSSSDTSDSSLLADSSFPVTEENALPTRAELELKATELGLTFHHRLKDENLAKMIDEALSNRSSEQKEG